MLRRVFTIASAVSLVLCVSAACLLARRGRVIGGRHEILSVYLKSRHSRYTLRAIADRLALCVPPKAAPRWFTPSPDFEVDPRPLPTLVALMRNEDFDWTVEHFDEQKAGDERLRVEWTEKSDAVLRYNRLIFTDAGLLIPGLLEALEDPQRAVAAHIILASFPSTGFQTISSELPRKPAGPFTFEFDGLRVDCSPLGKAYPGTTPGGGVDVYWLSWRADASQFPALSAQWHARFDRPLVAIRYSHLAAVTAVLPLMWLVHRLRRRALLRRRRRQNLCFACGYDLRGSRGRCPECGAGVVRAAPAKPPGA